MIKDVPADDVMLDRLFDDNVRQIKKKWYKEQAPSDQDKIEQSAG